MSLVNQLIAAIFAVLIGLVSGTLFIMSESSRSMLQNQLESHAQDSATHLGLYLAPYMAEDDSATIETAVNAIFDSGFYQRIIVTNGDGAVLFKKEEVKALEEPVPEWFQEMVQITPPSMFREITYQWRPVGKIFVQSSAGYAYAKLWKGAQDSIILFVCLSLFCLVAIGSLIRYLLRPLNQVEDQAIALSEKQYIEQKKLPSTRELRRVVEAMNRMVRQVKTMFEEQAGNIEELRRSAYQDNLTGLANQRSTQSQLAERLDYRKDFGRGTLLNIHLNNLQAINQQIGIDKTNNLLKHIAELLSEMARTADSSILGRTTGADFILLTDETDQDVIQRQLAHVEEETSKLYAQLSGSSMESKILSVGGTYSDEQLTSSQLLSEVRLAVTEAEKNQQLYNLFQRTDTTTEESTTTSDWTQHVVQAINQRKIFLQVQSVLSKAPELRPLQDEILARILDRDNKPAPAGEFINVVKELGLIAEMDRAVVERTLQQVEQRETPLTINLSHDALSDEAFHNWLDQQLAQLTEGARLMFEVDETSVLNDVDRARRFRMMLKERGIGFGVDHFGVHPSGFGYLYAIQPDYIKIDGSLIRKIDENAEDRFFVSSLISVAHSLGIEAYAEHVERESQLELLLSLGADGSQGYLHGAPRPLDQA